MKNIKVKLLWYDLKQSNGIVVDSDNNEYYIDSSVLKVDENLLNVRGINKINLNLLIDLNEDIKNVRCGKNVRILN